MQEASDSFDRGDYIDAITGWGTQLDRLLGESATQMALMVAGTAATGGVGGALGLSSNAITKLGGAFLGASLAGTDKTLSTIEEYKANNNGQMMDASQIAEAFALNTATLIPESFLLGTNFSSFLPRSVASKLGTAYTASATMSRLGAVATSTVGESFTRFRRCCRKLLSTGSNRP